jgi:hypothetical protein
MFKDIFKKKPRIVDVDGFPGKTAVKHEEWIWVEGYKGTDSGMRCRGYQYELNKRFDMVGAKIEECESGFHFCRDLGDVFKYYTIGFNNRFFKVRGLVRKKDYEEYGNPIEERHPISGYAICCCRSKLVASSIEFVSELSIDEILAATGCNVDEWTDEEKQNIIKFNYEIAFDIFTVRKLVEAGYSEGFAKCVVDARRDKIAFHLASQPDLSMDMKAWLIFHE